MERDNINQKELWDNEFVRTGFLFFISSLILLFSGLTFNNGIGYIVAPAQILAYFILALLNSLIDYKYYIVKRFQLFTAYDSRDTGRRGVIQFCFSVILYTGVYQTIMLPMGGLGTIEVFAISLLLVVTLIGFKYKKRDVSINPQMIIIMQIVLFLFKISTWFMPENIYNEYFEGNSFGRNLILFCLLFSGYFVVVVKKKVISEQAITKTGTGILRLLKRLVVFIVNLCIKLINLLISIACSPVIIIIVAVLLVIILPSLGIVSIEIMRESILSFFEAFLRVGTSTGKYQVFPDFFYCLVRIIASFGYFYYLWDIRHPFSEKDARNLIYIYSEVTSKENCLQLEIDNLSRNNMAKKIYKLVE